MKQYMQTEKSPSYNAKFDTQRGKDEREGSNNWRCHIISIDQGGSSKLVALVKTREGMIAIPIEEIQYVDIVDRALCFHVRDGSWIRSAKIRRSFSDDVREMVDLEDFCRIRAGLVINMKYIVSIGADRISLAGDIWLNESSRTCDRVSILMQKTGRL